MVEGDGETSTIDQEQDDEDDYYSPDEASSSGTPGAGPGLLQRGVAAPSAFASITTHWWCKRSISPDQNQSSVHAAPKTWTTSLFCVNHIEDANHVYRWDCFTSRQVLLDSRNAIDRLSTFLKRAMCSQKRVRVGT